MAGFNGTFSRMKVSLTALGTIRDKETGRCLVVKDCDVSHGLVHPPPRASTVTGGEAAIGETVILLHPHCPSIWRLNRDGEGMPAKWQSRQRLDLGDSSEVHERLDASASDRSGRAKTCGPVTPPCYGEVVLDSCSSSCAQWTAHPDPAVATAAVYAASSKTPAKKAIACGETFSLLHPPLPVADSKMFHTR